MGGTDEEHQERVTFTARNCGADHGRRRDCGRGHFMERRRGTRPALPEPADQADRAVGPGWSDRHSGAALVANPAQARPTGRDENRPGAGGAIGARFVATAAPDGYTLLVGNTSVLAVIPAVSAGAGYDPKQFVAVAKFSESYQILVVHPSLAVTTIGELIAYAKANPGKLNYAQTGAGGLPHLTGELFKSAAGVDIVGVPSRAAADSITGVLGAQVHMTFEGNHGPAAADPRWPAARARRDQPHPHAARRRSAYHDRGRRSGLRGHHLQRHRGAGRHPRADHPAPSLRPSMKASARPRCRPISAISARSRTRSPPRSSAPSSRPKAANG